MALTAANVQINITPTFARSYGTSNPSLPSTFSSYNIGTGSGFADRLYVGSRTATTSGDSVDLNGGGLLQDDQSAFNVAFVGLVHIVNKDAGATLTVGGGTNPIAGVSGTIPPLGFLVIASPSGFAVTGGSADTINVVSSAATSAYDIMLIGRTA